MPIFERSTLLNAPPEAVFQFHENPANLTRISPPSLRVIRIQAEPRARVGEAFSLHARQWGIPVRWQGWWVTVEPPTRLVDHAARSPFARFEHEHRFEPEGEGTRMTDRVDYTLLARGPAWVRRLADTLIARWVLAPMFDRRHAATREFFR